MVKITGLENAVIVLASGTIVPFEGFMAGPGQTPEGAKLYSSWEAAQAACKHDWLEHFGPSGPTHRMCLTCGREEKLYG